jgi:predicted transposase/invertase (TIGR01784 family)
MLDHFSSLKRPTSTAWVAPCQRALFQPRIRAQIRGKMSAFVSQITCFMTKLVHFDWAIKNLLRNKANFDILEGFLSELLQTNVVIEALLESESNKNTQEDKSNRVDLLVLTEKKEYLIIEVQASMEWDYLSRILYGTSKAVTEYIQAGQSYRDVRKIISVSIVFFDLGRGEDYVYHGTTEFRGTHQHDILQLGENEQKAYGPDKTPSDIFPEYYLIKVNQFNERIKDKFDEWVYFLKTEKIQPNFSAQGIKSAAKKLDVLALSDEDRRAYERYEDHTHYEASMHESHYGRGKLEGKVEGKIEIAKNMLALGLPVAIIAEATTLTEKEIQGLKI